MRFGPAVMAACALVALPAAVSAIPLKSVRPVASVNSAITLSPARRTLYSAQVAQPFPDGADALERQLVPRLTPAGRAWVAQEAYAFAHGQKSDDQVQNEAGQQKGMFNPAPANGGQSGSSTTYPNLGSLGDGDVMAICFIVMMEAAKSAQDDLKSIMDGVKQINKEKDGLRKSQDTINKLSAGVAGKNEDAPVDSTILNANGTSSSSSSSSSSYHFAATANHGGQLTAADISRLRADIKDQVDSKSELGETQSLRLQMAMDHVSKFMTALSNIEKKASDTDSAIIQNLK